MLFMYMMVNYRLYRIILSAWQAYSSILINVFLNSRQSIFSILLIWMGYKQDYAA